MNISARWAYLAVFIGVCGHASSEFFAVLSGVSGPEVSVWRYMIGAFGLLLFALALPETRDLWSPLKAEWRGFVPLALVGVSGAYLAFHWALDFATVIQVATVVTTMPIFIGLINRVVSGERISTVKMITGAMAVAGVAFLLTDGYLGALAGDGRTIYGVMLAICCAALGSGYAVLAKPYMARHGGIRITTLALLIGAAGLFVIVGLGWGTWVDPLQLTAMPPLAMWSLLALAILNTTITQVLWFGGLAAAPDITRASYLFFLKPVIAAVLAVLILAEEPTLLQMLAILVVTGSVFVEIFWPRLAAALKGAEAG
ncbi:DMT family transporter [Pikeienuella piscinae]|uniref:DMT family transporter n=1 Tax=Pikeienuella piscinae TaxID=2748098 RepID=A0A7L5C0P0_9RHOB|nr:DMT family transporter [Pikeienuella piscinae]QIE55409.1 DMT family transporter [Pikeienuella piscinae]